MYQKDNKTIDIPKFHEIIKNFTLTEQQMRKNGYPRPKDTSGKAIIYSPCSNVPHDGNVRTCWRCKKRFTVDENGLAIEKEACKFHDRGIGKRGYICCNKVEGSLGCTSHDSHVHRYEDHNNLPGYIQMKSSEDNSKNQAVVAIDCEMSYTTDGLELTRVTVIDPNHKKIYESYVKPLKPIVDYNEKFSGVNKNILDRCTTTLSDVHAVFLNLFSDKTLFVGHSLDSDLKALKILHDNIVDTSILFPHENPVYKKSLSTLAKTHLNRNIQSFQKNHDSAEDAIACMDLVIYKAKYSLGK